MTLFLLPNRIPISTWFDKSYQAVNVHWSVLSRTTKRVKKTLSLNTNSDHESVGYN